MCPHCLLMWIIGIVLAIPFIKPVFMKLKDIFKRCVKGCMGPYEIDKPCTGQWKGSSNQVLLYRTDRGLRQSKMPMVLKEVLIGETGDAVITGFSS